MFLHLTIYTIIIMKILWSKLPRYTWSCFWNMNFLVRFYYFWKYRFLLILKVFICECLHQILPWKEIKEAFPRRLQNKKRFLPKQNPGCPNKEYNAVFKHIHQNIKAYWRKQKSALINDWKNINSFREESKQSVDTKVWFVLHTVVRSGG